MFSLKTELTMAMVKDSLKKAYAKDRIKEETEASSFDSGNTVDGKKAKVYHRLEVDGELMKESEEELDIDDPAIKKYVESSNGDESWRVDRENDSEKKRAQLHHVVEVDGKVIAETSEGFDIDKGEQVGNEEDSSGENQVDPGMEEEIDPIEESLSQQNKEKLGQEKLEGLPLVDKKQLEEKANEILNRRIDRTRIFNRMDRHTEVEEESYKTTRESIPNSILILQGVFYWSHHLLGGTSSKELKIITSCSWIGTLSLFLFFFILTGRVKRVTLY